MSNPLISVIIPAYNAEDTICRALDSVKAQTFQDLEIIVIDDCSKDNTVEVVERWGEKYGRGGVTESRSEKGKSEKASLNNLTTQQPNNSQPSTASNSSTQQLDNTHTSLTLLKMDENSGPAAARNKGIAAARGEWIAFLDSDDLWLDWKLEDQLKVSELFPEAVLICGKTTIDFDEEIKRKEPAVSNCDEIYLSDFIEDNPVGTTTVLAKKDAINLSGGFDESFRGPEDIDLWMRVVKAGNIVKLDACVARYREQAGSLCMDPTRFLPEVIRVYRKAFAKGGALYSLKAMKGVAYGSRYTSAAWTYMECCQRLKALGCLLKSWMVCPGQLNVEKNKPFWRFAMLKRILFARR